MRYPGVCEFCRNRGKSCSECVFGDCFDDGEGGVAGDYD